MANGYFERGEVYWVNMGSGYAAEKGVGRPAVIVSKDEANNASPCVMVALFTTKYHEKPWEVYTNVTGRDSWVMCNEVMTYDKARVGKFFGKLGFSEMREVEDALELVFDLGYADTEALNAKDTEIEKLKAEIVELTNEVAREQARGIEEKAKHEDELLSYKVENAMWQKCYERSLDQLVKMKVTADVAVRANSVVGQAAKAPKIDPPVERNSAGDPPAEDPVENELLDINTATGTALKKIGFSVALAKAVIKARPFNSVEDLKKVPGMAKTKYQILAPKLCCVPVAKVVEEPVIQNPPEQPEILEQPEKLNINTMSARDFREKLGIANSTSYCIVAYRREHGPYEKLEDMLNAKQVFQGTIDKIRDKVFCGPGIEEKPATPGNRKERKTPDLTKYAGNKVNINTATAREINEKTGLSLTVAYSIVGCRNRDGKYRAVEDLENVPRFTEYHMKHYAPMFEV